MLLIGISRGPDCLILDLRVVVPIGVETCCQITQTEQVVAQEEKTGLSGLSMSPGPQIRRYICRQKRFKAN